MTVMWGLKSCDTCKKAKKALEARGAAVTVKDVRADGVSASDIAVWLDAVGGDVLINRRGTTWRGLSDADKARAESDPVALLSEHPAIIKRSVFVFDNGTVIVGFGAKEQAALEARL